VNSFLLTWDGSDEALDPDEYSDAIAQTSHQHEVDMQWSVGLRRSGLEAGDKVYLLRQRTDRGIVASGYLRTDDIESAPRWDDPTKTANYADVTWDVVVSPEDRLPIEELLANVEGHSWNSVYSSGQMLDPEAAAKLEQRWTAHLKGIGIPTA
jgi:hypothetical protein